MTDPTPPGSGDEQRPGDVHAHRTPGDVAQGPRPEERWGSLSVLAQSEEDARSNRVARRPWLVGGGIVLVLTTLAVAVWLWSSPTSVLGRAVATTLEQGSAHTRVTATIGDLPLLGDVDLVVADGEVDFASGEAVLRREIIGGARTELRYVGDGVFLQVPLAEDRWVRLSEATRTTGDGVGGDHPTDVVTVAPGIGNPVAIVGLLRVLEGEPQRLRADEVNGVPVEVYEVVVDLDAARDALPDDARDLVSRLRALAGGGRLPLEVAIDDDHLIRSVRFSAEVSLPIPLSPRLDNRVVFSDFGVPVDVEAPPADRIVDLDASALTELDPLAALRQLLSVLPGLP